MNTGKSTNYSPSKTMSSRDFELIMTTKRVKEYYIQPLLPYGLRGSGDSGMSNRGKRYWNYFDLEFGVRILCECGAGILGHESKESQK